MSLTLGEKLRQAREARGISISEVAEQTRISALYLEAIENNDYRTLPGGIFNKGFVKSFAKFVGVDEQEALQDYSRLLVEQGNAESADDPKTYRPQVLTDDQSRSSMIPTLIFAVIILGLLTGGVLWGLNYYQNSQNPAVTNSGNTNQTANGATNTNTNVNANPTPAPAVAVNEINVELRTSETVAVNYTNDGKKTYKNVEPSEPLAIKAQQSAKVSYYRGFADKVQLTVNGRQIAPPQAAAKRAVVEFEITKDNIAQIMQSGTITPTAAP